MSAMAGVMLAMVLVADIGAPSECLDVPANQKLTAAYLDCVTSKARRLEKSGESADNVATAVMGACREPERVVVAAYAACKPVSSADLTAELDRREREKVIETVVQIRADRRSR